MRVRIVISLGEVMGNISCPFIVQLQINQLIISSHKCNFSEKIIFKNINQHLKTTYVQNANDYTYPMKLPTIVMLLKIIIWIATALVA